MQLGEEAEEAEVRQRSRGNLEEDNGFGERARQHSRESLEDDIEFDEILRVSTGRNQRREQQPSGSKTPARGHQAFKSTSATRARRMAHLFQELAYLYAEEAACLDEDEGM